MATKFEFRQLGGDELSDLQLRQAAGLIYDTDPYIYPAMFASREEACDIFPVLFRSGRDEMFRFDNLFVCLSGEDLVGIVLWHRGPLVWEEGPYLETCSELGIRPASDFDLVKPGYFDGYQRTPPGTVSVINVCVSASCRGQGVGRKLMAAFLDSRPQAGSAHELVVLADNAAAIGLYESFGFGVIGRAKGFAVGEDRPDILSMARRS